MTEGISVAELGTSGLRSTKRHETGKNSSLLEMNEPLSQVHGAGWGQHE